MERIKVKDSERKGVDEGLVALANNVLDILETASKKPVREDGFYKIHNYFQDVLRVSAEVLPEEVLEEINSRYKMVRKNWTGPDY